MFTVLIDRLSVKRNPRAGDTVSYQPGRPGPYIQTKIYQLGDNWIKEEWVGAGVNNDFPNNTLKEPVYLQSHEEIQCVERPQDWPTYDSNISISCPIYPLYHHPLAQYLYKYLPCEVECYNCKARFDYSELETDSYFDDFYENICPKCKICECCEIKYERIEDVVRESTTPISA